MQQPYVCFYHRDHYKSVADARAQDALFCTSNPLSELVSTTGFEDFRELIKTLERVSEMCVFLEFDGKFFKPDEIYELLESFELEEALHHLIEKGMFETL